METGFLFNTTEEFSELINELDNNRSFRQKIGQNSIQFIIENHSLNAEREFYQKEIRNLFK